MCSILDFSQLGRNAQITGLSFLCEELIKKTLDKSSIFLFFVTNNFMLKNNLPVLFCIIVKFSNTPFRNYHQLTFASLSIESVQIWVSAGVPKFPQHLCQRREKRFRPHDTTRIFCLMRVFWTSHSF